MIRIRPRVERALQKGEAVVALESTVVTHGLPRPDNLALAERLERVVEAAGAVPATVGLIQGKLVVGLNRDELEHLATHDVEKASLWNLAALAAAGADAGTTVATTLHAAAGVGIKVFATGGIGGVHKGEHGQTFDESADLGALARYSVVTVCAGPKSILDVSATVERLESLGVPVLGYQTDFLAGFHVPATRLPVAARCESPEEVARLFYAGRALGLPSAALVCKPVSEGLDADELSGWLAQAQHEAAAERLSGKDLTPYLLARLAELSYGRSVEVNRRLLEENARLGAEIARALAQEPTEVTTEITTEITLKTTAEPAPTRQASTSPDLTAKSAREYQKIGDVP